MLFVLQIPAGQTRQLLTAARRLNGEIGQKSAGMRSVPILLLSYNLSPPEDSHGCSIYWIFVRFFAVIFDKGKDTLLPANSWHTTGRAVWP